MIYRANNVPSNDDMYDQVVSVCRSTSHNVSSMLKDVLQHSETEINSINGRLIEMAKAVGIHAPGHEMVTLFITGLRPQSNI
ncbi:2-dehydropantoate 2-reductase [compost metagenome]